MANGYVIIARDYCGRITYTGIAGNVSRFIRTLGEHGRMAASGLAEPLSFEALGFLLTDDPARLAGDLTAEYGPDYPVDEVPRLLAHVRMDYREMDGHV